MTAEAQIPFVSVVIPCRNERGYIGRVLASVLASDWPRDRLEVLAVDGMSDDGTREAVAAAAAADPRVRLLDNPARFTPHAVNVGVRAARGDFILRVDAHGEIPPDYIKTGVALLQARPNVWAVGGPLTRAGDGPGGALVAAVLSQPFSTGNTRVRAGDVEGPVDAVGYPMWRRDVFSRIGYFDETLVRNQDDDFDLRIRSAGGVTYQAPAMRAVYYVRSSVANLLRQYSQYGFWKVVVARKHGRYPDWKPLAPLAYAAAVCALTALSFFEHWAAWAPAAMVAAYIVADVFSAASVAKQLSIGVFFAAAGVFPALHAAYAWGMIRGLWTVYILGLSPAQIRDRGLQSGLSR